MFLRPTEAEYVLRVHGGPGPVRRCRGDPPRSAGRPSGGLAAGVRAAGGRPVRTGRQARRAPHVRPARTA
ncbi:hypothetical protein, partial [Streptomyces sp. NPDC057052]|uniref:hypothetical protein n=1 Tax=Streptomyces sp. NPDC057052 TaxID=3346010 RepID=UPI00362F0D8E